MICAPKTWPVLVLLAAQCACGMDTSRSASENGDDTRTATGIRFLAGEDADGFERAYEPHELVFPTDHGSHAGFRNEWWYYTGNLLDANERHFGFEVTFFRIALVPAAKPRESKWVARELWMAHFALTDTAARKFYSAERLARGALDVAGATSEPFKVWVKDWSVRGSAGVDSASLVLAAQDADVSVSLELNASKPLVLHGNGGLDSKGPEPGNASFYYIGVPQHRSDLVALQLSDGRDLMFYRLRESDGGSSPFSGGTLIDRDGAVDRLTSRDVELIATRHWTSQLSGATYPIAWRLGIPRYRTELVIEPVLESQEIDLSVRYWEGAVRANGSVGDVGLTAVGYLELAGY